VTFYPMAEELVRPVLRVGMPRVARLVGPGGTMHVVAQCNNRIRGIGDFELRICRRSAMSDEPKATDAYTLVSNHVHLLL
jgi:hypothetical protein